MFTKILVGIDEAPHARDAAALGEALAQASGGADLELIAAFQDPLLPFPPTFVRNGHRERDARVALTGVRTQWAPSAHTRTVPDVSPARALRRIAHEEGADLIVMGSGRDARDGSTQAGRLGRQVLHDATCAVAFAAAGMHERPPRLSTIVVGVDGGPESRVALDVACGLADQSGASITAVSVFDVQLPINYTVWGELMALAEWDEQAEPRRARQAAALAEVIAGRDVTPLVLAGRPERELIEASADADLLVLGSRHWGALARVAVGSTGEALCRHARSSVLVVPRPAATSDPVAQTISRESREPLLASK